MPIILETAVDRFAEATGWKKPDDWGWKRGERPVINVSWNGARTYARRLSEQTGQRYRLPTEAEWEYAARATNAASRFWGGDPNAACAYANGVDRAAPARFPSWTTADCDDSALFTARAGSYRRNPFGLSDMLGNAREWVGDCWHESCPGAPVDGSAWLEAGGGDCVLRVLRDGGWDSIPGRLRSASRRSPADASCYDFGMLPRTP